jgi:hypothetical protein
MILKSTARYSIQKRACRGGKQGIGEAVRRIQEGDESRSKLVHRERANYEGSNGGKMAIGILARKLGMRNIFILSPEIITWQNGMRTNSMTCGG